MPSSNSWREQFDVALQAKNADELKSLVSEYHQDSMVALLPGEKHAYTSPLAIAAGKRRPWGFGFLLEIGEPVTEEVVKTVLRYTNACDSVIRQKALKKFWVPLMPQLLSNPGMAEYGLAMFLKSFTPEWVLENHMAWKAAELETLVRAVGDKPCYVSDFDSSLTPLQAAWMANNPYGVEELLLIGASATDRCLESALPTWTLRNALEAITEASKKHLTPQEAARFAADRWPSSNEKIQQQLEISARWWGRPEEWKKVLEVCMRQSIEVAAQPRLRTPGPRM